MFLPSSTSECEMNRTFEEYKQHFQLDANFNKPNAYKGEEVDHVNISVLSKNRVGRFFDPGYCININYPFIGKFRSISSMMYWLKSPDRDDRIRTLTGTRLNKYIKENGLRNKKVPNYTAILAQATWLKLKARPDIIEEIKKLDDDFEFLSYRTNKVTGIRITTEFAPNIIPVVKEIISAVKDNREPDFDQFLTNKGMKGSWYLEGLIEIVAA